MTALGSKKKRGSQINGLNVHVKKLQKVEKEHQIKGRNSGSSL
jgi:hypothetical protein